MGRVVLLGIASLLMLEIVARNPDRSIPNLADQVMGKGLPAEV